MVSTLASALDFAFFGGQEPKRQLLDYLQDKEMLLVLDNLEHLLEGTGLIAEILASSSNIKILATSRERLDLHAEWVYDLEGLSYPTFPQPPLPRGALERSDKRGDFDAVQLFMQAARQAQADFSVDERDLQAVIRICQLVEGMPLAIELAASWLRLLTVEEVAAQLEKGMDLLEAATRDLPARHKSVRAVFEHSWKLLRTREREALRKLSVFQGGFTLEAAEAVAGTSLPLLLALVNKSFLRRNPHGRFSQHPLVWQFAQERSHAHPEERGQAEEHHSAYFMAFVADRRDAYRSPKAKRVFAGIEEDIENVEAAWRWAAEHGREDWLHEAVATLNWFYFSRSWFERGLELLNFAKERAREGGLLYGCLLTHIGAHLNHQGRFDESIPLLEQGLSVLERHDSKGDLAWHLRILGLAYGMSGTNRDEAAHAFRCALELHRELEDAEGVAMMLNNLAYHAKDPKESIQMLEESIHLSRNHGAMFTLALTLDTLAELLCYRSGNDYDAAKKAMEECFLLFEETGELFYRLFSIGHYARILIASGGYQAAEARCQEMLALCETLEQRVAAQMRAEAHSVLGHLAYLRGNFEEARNLCRGSYLLDSSFSLGYIIARSSETLVRVSLAQGHLDEAEGWLKEAWKRLESHPMRGDFKLSAAKLACLNLWGELAVFQGNEQEARKRFHEALTLAQEGGYLPSMLEALVGIAKLLDRRRKKEQAIDLLALAAVNPGSTQETRDEARRVLGELEPALTPEMMAAASERYREKDTQAVVEDMVVTLSAWL
jgi:tetratricopeptide (TPR) repeat protein